MVIRAINLSRKSHNLCGWFVSSIVIPCVSLDSAPHAWRTWTDPDTLWTQDAILGSDDGHEVPTIYVWPIFEAYVRGYPHKIWPEIWYSCSSILGPWNSHWWTNFSILQVYHPHVSSNIPGNSSHTVPSDKTKRHLSSQWTGYWLS